MLHYQPVYPHPPGFIYDCELDNLGSTTTEMSSTATTTEMSSTATTTEMTSTSTTTILTSTPTTTILTSTPTTTILTSTASEQPHGKREYKYSLL
jgi:hypothetical protein